VPMLETIEPGLGESQQLSAVGRDAGILICDTEGMWRGTEAALMVAGAFAFVEGSVLQVILRSSMVLSVGAAEM
jgi:hypothetical protein